MVVGDVTISASPRNAILGDVITFTGRVLIDGLPPPSTVGVSIILDTSPAPHVTLASGDTDTNGYYDIDWTSNYSGTLPIYAFAAAYQGFNSPTIMVGIVTGDVVVYLEPPLHNALLEFRYRSYGSDELLYSQYSVLGRTEWPQGTFTDYDFFEVRFPAQTVGGVSYLEASTGTFMYQNAPLVFTLVLQVAEISTTLTIDAPASAEPGEIFTIITTLTTEAGEPLAGMEIILTVPEIPEIIIRAYTGVDGICEFMLSLPQGIYTLRADFAGTTTLGASTVTSKLRTGALELTALAPLAAIALLAYFTMRK